MGLTVYRTVMSSGDENPGKVSLSIAISEPAISLMMTVISTMILMILISTTSSKDSQITVQIHIDVEQPVAYRTSDRFLSVSLDTSLIYRSWAELDLGSVKIQNLAAALNPSYIRFGGTYANLLLFEPTSNRNTELLPRLLLSSEDDTKLMTELGEHTEDEYFEMPMALAELSNVTLFQDDFIQLYRFVEKSGWDLIFDLNVLLRRGSKWDPDNAKKIIEFADTNGFDIAGWELGNEPNTFMEMFGVNLTASQLGKDVVQLRSLLNKYPRYRDSLLLGPDVTRGNLLTFDYIEEFLEESKSVVDGVTWHHYYFNGRTAKPVDYLNPGIFNSLRRQINRFIKAVSKVNSDTPLWLGETSSGYGGGTKGMSDRFGATFIWLDKLGLCASMGVKVVVRQSFYGSWYSLLHRKTTDPVPDYWVSLLYKRLVGPPVLGLTHNFTRYERFYVHCTRAAKNKKEYTPGSVTVYGMNLKSRTVKVVWGNEWEGVVLQYLLSSDELESPEVYLNGDLLKLRRDESVPFLVPKVIFPEDGITLPPHTLGFWVIPEAHVKACIGRK